MRKIDPNERKVIDIGACQRCGFDHKGLVFRPFAIPIAADLDGLTWDYWALCPVSGDPVLLTVGPLKAGALNNVPN